MSKGQTSNQIFTARYGYTDNLILHSHSESLQKSHKKVLLKRVSTKHFQFHQLLAVAGDAAPGYIPGEAGREAQPHWDYSCESWSRTDFSVTSFMLMVADNEDFSYECLKLFDWEVTRSKCADKRKGDKNL